MQEFEELDRRSREIFQKLVESYLERGSPVASKALSDELSEKISPATVRNVLAQLEATGLLGSQHISSGRLPTERGLRFFVDGILEMKSLSGDDQNVINNAIRASNRQIDQGFNLYERTGAALSQLSKSASLVLSKKTETRIEHIDFVLLSKSQALVILVSEDGKVDNRLFAPPEGITSSHMEQVANYINAQLDGHTVSELKTLFEAATQAMRQDIDDKMTALLKQGSFALVNDTGRTQMIVRGRANLIEDSKSEAELEQLRQLLDDLESKNDLIEILDLVDAAAPVRVFIGSENKLFSLKSSSLVLSPYMNAEGKIIGAVGVIGPTRLNYARVVPLVSYTAGLVGRYHQNEDEYDQG